MEFCRRPAVWKGWQCGHLSVWALGTGLILFICSSFVLISQKQPMVKELPREDFMSFKAIKPCRSA